MMLKNRQALNRQRLLDSVVSDPDSGCWLWRGQISNSGYGRIMQMTPGVYAARLLTSCNRVQHFAKRFDTPVVGAQVAYSQS